MREDEDGGVRTCTHRCAREDGASGARGRRQLQGLRPAGMQALVLLAAKGGKHERMQGCSNEVGAGDGDPGEDGGGGAWRTWPGRRGRGAARLPAGTNGRRRARRRHDQRWGCCPAKREQRDESQKEEKEVKRERGRRGAARAYWRWSLVATTQGDKAERSCSGPRAASRSIRDQGEKR